MKKGANGLERIKEGKLPGNGSSSYEAGLLIRSWSAKKAAWNDCRAEEGRSHLLLAFIEKEVSSRHTNCVLS